MRYYKVNRNINRKFKRHVPYFVAAFIAFIGYVLSELFFLVPSDDTNITNTETIKESYLVTEETEFKTSGDIVVSYVDVGQGSCTLIYNEDKSEAIMIDTGIYTEYENVKAALDSAGIHVLDCLVLTHPDADHIGGAVELTEDKDITVKSVMQVYGITNDTDTYEMVQNNIDEFNIPVINPTAGEIYEFCGAKFTVLGPVVTDQSVYEDTNSYSIVLRMDYGNTSFLFTGDAPTTEMNDIVTAGYDIDVDVYQLSHHGSFNGCNSYIHLTLASPKIAVASCGKDNSYGFPHDEVVTFMSLGKIPLYRTDMNDTIIMRTDGNNIF